MERCGLGPEMAVAFVESVRNDLRLPKAVSMRCLRGRDAILASYPLLSSFAASCGQPEGAEDLTYFISKPGILNRAPVLLLVVREDIPHHQPLQPADLLGTLLVYEYSVGGLRSGLFTSNDRSGRTSLIAPSELRFSIAFFASTWLVRHRAHLVMLTFGEGTPSDIATSNRLIDSGIPVRWATRTRSVPDFLPLQGTMDDTLASIGQRTRSNMRYYRRRAEKELGCVFSPELEITPSELLAFNRECMYAVPDRVAAWRLRNLRELGQPLLMGLRDRDGRLLSLIGGRRLGTSTEIFWQMNRNDLPQYSLSLVLRSYLLEHEIARGAKRFYVEGGSSHPINRSFRHCNLTDLVVLRSSIRASLVCSLARHIVNRENDLGAMLLDRSIEWKTTTDKKSLSLSQDLREPT